MVGPLSVLCVLTSAPLLLGPYLYVITFVFLPMYLHRYALTIVSLPLYPYHCILTLVSLPLYPYLMSLTLSLCYRICCIVLTFTPISMPALSLLVIFLY